MGGIGCLYLFSLLCAMNILMLYTSSPYNEAGSVALDLFNEFRRNGHNVKLLVNEYGPDYPEGITSLETPFLIFKNNFKRKVRNKLQLNKLHAAPEYHFQDLDEQKKYYSTAKILRKAGMRPDAIVVLYAKNFLNSENIYQLYRRTGAPIYWFNFDMAPYTGGCHYSWDCTGYQRSCGSCPGLYSTDPYDLTYQNFQYKKAYYDKIDIRIISGSEWQYRQLQKSTLFKNSRIKKILLGINPDIYKPVPKTISREKVNIPADRKVIFFGAVHLENKRKGFAYLITALKKLKELVKDNPELDRRILLLIAGQRFDQIENELPFEYHYMGMLKGGPEMASAYQAADLFVCPSLHDAGPTMINQSVMCGTPVVSFETGVSLDLVIPGMTGYRARLMDSDEMAAGILRLLTTPEQDYETLRKNCRELALKLIHPQVVLDSWMKLINEQTGEKVVNG